MSDLISRQTAIATAVRAAIDWHRLANPQYSIAYCIGEAMRQLPSAEPEIIHCRDCEYGEIDQDNWWFCTNLGCQIGESDGSGFCADAEKRRREHE